MNIVLYGAEGRVGRLLHKMAVERGHNVYPVDIKGNFGANFDFFRQAEVVIDFSCAQATREVCDFCRARRLPLVTGVTGRSEQQQRLIEELKQVVPVCEKANFSIGAEALAALTELACKLLADWDCEIVEIHRRDKADSPSGTAKNLASMAAKRRNFCNVTVHSLRCGSAFGKHTVIFASQGESLTLTHEAENAEIFARGALLKAESICAAQNVSR